LYVGEKLLESGNTDDALQWGQQVQAQYPDQEQGRWMEFNYTVLINSGKNEDALRLAQQALAANPADTRWEEFTYIALNNLVGNLLNNQRIVESRRVLAANGTNLNMGHYNALNVVVTNFELVQQLNTLHSSDDIQSALNAINEAASILPRSRVDEMRSSVLVQGANLLAMEEGWRDAIVFAESALTRYGKNAILENNLRAYRSNRVIELHNAFVDLWNAGNYEQARAFIREALQEFPTNAQLMQDQNFARN
jgi:tetratricopeptide (TPR) repeat protein